MRLCLILVSFILATLVSYTHALLGAKLALLGLGSGKLFGEGDQSGRGYGNGNYNGAYYGQQNYPVFSGGYGNGYGGYDYGRQSYSGGGSYSGVKVVKVIVDNQNSGGYSTSGWAPVPVPTQSVSSIPVQTSYVSASAPRPVVQAVEAPQPLQYAVQNEQTGSAQSYQYQSSQDQQEQQPISVQLQSPSEVNVATSAAAPSQISYNLQPPAAQPTLVQPLPQFAYLPPSQPNQIVKTIKLIVDDSGNNQVGYNRVPFPNYGPPSPSSNVFGDWLRNGNGYAGSWGGSSSLSNGWNRGYKKGGIWEKLGC